MKLYKNISKLPIRIVVGREAISLLPGESKLLPRSVDVLFYEQQGAIRRIKMPKVRRPAVKPVEKGIEKKIEKKEKIEVPKKLGRKPNKKSGDE